MLVQRLARLAFRLRLRRSLDGALKGLAWGLAGALLVVIAAKFLPLRSPIAIAGGAAAAGVLAGAILGFRRRVPLRQAAALADLGAGSAEVISTALETTPHDRFGAALHARAEAVLNSKGDASLLPRLRPAVPWRAIVLAVLLGALLPVPRFTFAAVPPGNAIATISPTVLRALERSAKEMKRIGDQFSNPEITQLSEELRKLAASVRLGEMSKKEALAKVAALTDRAEEAKRDLESKTDTLRALAKNPETRPLAAEAARGNEEGAKSQAGELAKKASSGALPSEAMKRLQQTLEAAAKEGRGELARAAATAAKELAKPEGKEFAAALGRLARELKGAWVPEEMLDAPAAELAAGKELADALKGLEAAEGDLMTDEELEAALANCPDCGEKKDGKG